MIGKSKDNMNQVMTGQHASPFEAIHDSTCLSLLVGPTQETETVRQTFTHSGLLYIQNDMSYFGYANLTQSELHDISYFGFVKLRRDEHGAQSQTIGTCGVSLLYNSNMGWNIKDGARRSPAHNDEDLHPKFSKKRRYNLFRDKKKIILKALVFFY